MTIIQSLWIGNTLSTMEIYSLKSFLNTGHTVHLYVYEVINNIPDGVIIKDGNDILPENLIFKYVLDTLILKLSIYFLLKELYSGVLINQRNHL